MKQAFRRPSCFVGAICGTALAAGVILSSKQAWSYVDENLIEHIGNTWAVAPTNDAYRDADTVEYVIENAREGDTILLLSGRFNFAMPYPVPGTPERTIAIHHNSLHIRGQTTRDADGTVNYLTAIDGSSTPFEIGASGVLIEGLVIDGLPDEPPPQDRGKMLNISTRGTLAAGEKMIGGFVVGGAPKDRQTVLVRAVGPSLAGYDVESPCANPKLAVIKGTTEVGSNDDWCCNELNKAACIAAAERSGAFQLTPGAKDASLVLNLAPGAYTVVCEGVDESCGEILVEVFLAPVN